MAKAKKLDTNAIRSRIADIEYDCRRLEDDLDELEDHAEPDDEAPLFNLDSYEQSVVLEHLEAQIAANSNGLQRRAFEKLHAYLKEVC